MLREAGVEQLRDVVQRVVARSQRARSPITTNASDERAERHRDVRASAAARAGARCGSCGPSRHQQADLLDGRRRLRRARRRSRPSYMTAMRSASARISSRSSLISSTPTPSAAACAQVRVHRLDRRRRRARASGTRRRGPAGRPANSRASTSFCRLPPESWRAGAPARAPHVVVLRSARGRALADRAETEQRPARERPAAVRLQHRVRRDRAGPARRRCPAGPPARGRCRRAIAARGIAGAQPLAAHVHAALRGRPHARDRLGQLALAVAGDAGDAEDLARPNRQRDVPQRRAAPVAVGRRAARRASTASPVACFARRSLGARATSRPTISAASDFGVVSACVDASRSSGRRAAP